MNQPSIYLIQTGYFLLEFLMVLFTVLTLITIVLSCYYPIYIERAKIAEGITLTSHLVRTRLAEYYSIYGQFPVTASELSLGEDFKITGTYTSHISIDNSAVTATLLLPDNSPALLTVRPALLGDGEYQIILPMCGYAIPPAAAVIYGENQTNIPPHYLTHTCR
jgi:hypothetical protein